MTDPSDEDTKPRELEHLARETWEAELRAAAFSENYLPGEPAPASGQYEIVDARGRSTGEERTSVQGHTLPPTPESDQQYRLVDPTRNRAGVVPEGAREQREKP